MGIGITPNSDLGKTYHQSHPEIDLSTINKASTNHQGCFEENIADKLKVVAVTPDGLIEAVKIINYPNLFLATQYHFEYNVVNIASKIFKEFTA
ncbi:gamma-glutamyl-gamma-aminobutyrate hydrolase family protein [Rickettsiales bacterium]|nr:gamma-glutamyl-gamma-aminobutyrate hydrolase family protein [Rickettsiales bacterium]